MKFTKLTPAQPGIFWAKQFSVGRMLLVAGGALTLFLGANSARAAGTIAGTDIVNVAQATYDTPGGTITVDSNIVTIKVDELLDVAVVSGDPGDVTAEPAQTSRVLTYKVTNTGNGPEAFTLSADTAKTGDEFDPIFEQIVLDTDGNGVYDPGVDTVYAADTNDPVLSPDESTTVFILSNIPATVNDAQRAEVELSAVANTGSGAPGTLFAAAGEGGGDAIVGATGASSAGSGYLVVQAAQVTLIKSAIIVDQFGGSEAIPGATITYQLVATTEGTGSLTNLAIADDVPADTTYQTESITLDGAAQTDSNSDADAGSFDSNRVAVALGAVPGGQTRTITFKVTIN